MTILPRHRFSPFLQELKWANQENPAQEENVREEEEDAEVVEVEEMLAEMLMAGTFEATVAVEGDEVAIALAHA